MDLAYLYYRTFAADILYLASLDKQILREQGSGLIGSHNCVTPVNRYLDMNSSEIVQCLGDLHTASSTEALIDWAVNDLAAKFGTDFNVLTRYSQSGELIGATIGKGVLPSVWNFGPLIQEHFSTHPIHNSLVSTSSPHLVSRTTDFASQREIDELLLFKDAYRHMGARYQMTLILKSEHYGACSLTFARNGSNYTDDQARTVEAVSRHLEIALSRLSQIETMRNRLDASVFTFGVLRNGSRWYYTKTTENILDRLSHCFGRAKEKFMVPMMLAMHLQALMRSPNLRLLKDNTNRPWKLSMMKNSPNEWDVLIEPASSSTFPAPAPLTKRETEISHWLCEGKSNAEMAAILGISRKTVEKHVEHIFDKIGVNTRSGAVRHILQHLSQVIEKGCLYFLGLTIAF